MIKICNGYQCRDIDWICRTCRNIARLRLLMFHRLVEWVNKLFSMQLPVSPTGVHNVWASLTTGHLMSLIRISVLDHQSVKWKLYALVLQIFKCCARCNSCLFLPCQLFLNVWLFCIQILHLKNIFFTLNRKPKFLHTTTMKGREMDKNTHSQ